MVNERRARISTLQYREELPFVCCVGFGKILDWALPRLATVDGNQSLNGIHSGNIYKCTKLGLAPHRKACLCPQNSTLVVLPYRSELAGSTVKTNTVSGSFLCKLGSGATVRV